MCNVMNYQCSDTVSPVEYLMMTIAKKIQFGGGYLLHNNY